MLVEAAAVERGVEAYDLGRGGVGPVLGQGDECGAGVDEEGAAVVRHVGLLEDVAAVGGGEGPRLCVDGQPAGPVQPIDFRMRDAEDIGDQVLGVCGRLDAACFALPDPVAVDARAAAASARCPLHPCGEVIHGPVVFVAYGGERMFDQPHHGRPVWSAEILNSTMACRR
ncbi:hypothetical protein ACFC4G_40480 [Streptomyces sp. NPDC056002]|uniref:hypothetical protein n=1 Tax=Streptomyces sp. NPDC056002 TaxID=3345675 RepID=UPI0035E2F592